EHDFYRAKLATARFYAEHIMPLAHAFRVAVTEGSPAVLALEEAQF
ncbi:MAG: acyl-CoA dehydrogenase C-terminal domain-containing protein, partial [Rhodocyclaceae bacterium]|nr:acyl-CoA dehydrogenase C-terminal domain-containing protein [Rhodocyclaceae bacterium]